MGVPLAKTTIPNAVFEHTTTNGVYLTAVFLSSSALPDLAVVLNSFTGTSPNLSVLLFPATPDDDFTRKGFTDDIPFIQQKATDGMRISAGKIVCIPPGYTLHLDNDCIQLLESAHSQAMAYDNMLNTLAAAYETRCIALPLDESFVAYTNGLAYLQKKGGLAVVKINSQAVPGDLPGFIDLQLPAAQIGTLLKKYILQDTTPSRLQPVIEKENNLNTVIEHFDGFVWSVDRDLKYVILNTRLREQVKATVGVDPQPGDKMLDILALLDISKASEWEHIYALAFEGKKQHLVQEFCPNGQPLFLEFSVIPVWKDNRVTGISCFARDITAAVASQRKAKEGEIRFRSLLEHNQDIIVLLNAEGKIVYGSPSIENIFGTMPVDYLNNSAFQYIHPDDITVLAEKLQEVLANPNVSIAVHTQALTPDGRQLWLEGTVTNLLATEGVNGIVCNFKDVTERVMAELLQEQSEMRFRSLIEHSSDLIIMVSGDGKFIYGSPSVTKCLGYDPEDYTQKELFLFVHPDSLAEARVMLENILLNPGTPFTVQLKLQHKDGHPIWTEGLATNLLGVPGINALVGNFRDISERKFAEIRLRESEDLYRNLFNKSPLPIWLCDAVNFNFLEVNEAALRTYNYTRTEFLQMKAFDLIPMEEHAGLGELLSSNAASYQPLLRKHIRKNGEILFMEVLAHRINYRGNLAYQLVANDITEKIKLRHQLLEEKVHRHKEVTQATLHAQETEREDIGRELHDNVNQLLTTARLYLSCTNEQNMVPNENILHCREIITSAMEEIRKLTSTLTQSFHKEIGLQLSIEDLAENIRLTNSFIIDLQMNLPDEQLLEDKLKTTLYRIIQEQLNNIIKHAGASRVKISLHQQTDKLSLHIADDGCGFDIDQKRNGIGLNNIFSRADIYNGKVKIISAPGQGCKLWIHFPL